MRKIAVGVLCSILCSFALSCRQKPAGSGKGPPDWGAIREGMTQDQVRAVLGEPKSMRTHPIEGTFWEYPEADRHGMVRFNTETGRVASWNAP